MSGAKGRTGAVPSQRSQLKVGGAGWPVFGRGPLSRYVLIAPGPDPNLAEDLIRALNPAQVFRLAEEDLRRRAELIAHVRSRQTR